MTHVFYFGYPKACGGANTECWHLLKLWRANGVEVTLIPTWDKADPIWKAKLDGIGCRTLEVAPDDLGTITNLPGAIVVAMCNTKFADEAHRLRMLGCRIVWAECMNWMFPQTRNHLRDHGLFDVHWFQSQYQADQLIPQLRRFGTPNAVIIPGAFDPEEFPLNPLPHKPGEIFTIGRISRNGVDKFPADLWAQYDRVNHPKRVRIMGWSAEVERQCGKPPVWAEVLEENAETPQAFLSSLHALAPGVGCARENWPRVGLEAMSVGVPLVVEMRGGWRQMVANGTAGDLCGSIQEMAYRLEYLAYDEQHRMEYVTRARWDLENELANPRKIWAAWKQLFGELDERNRRTAQAVSVAG